ERRRRQARRRAARGLGQDCQHEELSHRLRGPATSPSDGYPSKCSPALFLGRRPMDGPVFALFALAALAGGFVSGFSGFAMGLVVSGVWLHIITPMQTATLIAGYGLLTQGYGIFKLRHLLDLRKAWPLALGTVIGI